MLELEWLTEACTLTDCELHDFTKGAQTCRKMSLCIISLSLLGNTHIAPLFRPATRPGWKGAALLPVLARTHCFSVPR